MTSEREPAFNVPPVVAWTIAALVAIHVARQMISAPEDLRLLLLLAFLPARYDPSFALQVGIPGGTGAQVWTFVTYSVLHADLTHLGVNAVWLLAFGSPVAWRFGPFRFLLFAAITAAAGAGAHLLGHWGEVVPMIGASGAISGLTAAAIRFVFQAGGPLGAMRRRGREAFSMPAVPLSEALRTPEVLIFIAVWFGINLLYAVGSVPIGPEGVSVAWQAHVGGFVAGLMLFRLFDPAETGSRDDRWGRDRIA